MSTSPRGLVGVRSYSISYIAPEGRDYLETTVASRIVGGFAKQQACQAAG